MRESTIEDQVRRYAVSKGFLCYKFTSPAHRSVPDRLFITPTGQVAFIELKAPGKKPSPLQEREMRILKGHGVPVIWADSAPVAKAFLDSLLPPNALL